MDINTQFEQLINEDAVTEPDAKEAYELALDEGIDSDFATIISKDTKYATLFAVNVLEGAFPDGEEAIAKSGRASAFYAVHGKGKPFPLGEESILKTFDLQIIADYTKGVKGGEWEDAEKLITRYFTAEEAIKYFDSNDIERSVIFENYYLEALSESIERAKASIEGDVPDLQKHIVKSPAFKALIAYKNSRGLPKFKRDVIKNISKTLGLDAEFVTSL
jgi:hypothetical protein